MNNIEEQLWDYIDGFCTPEEQQSLARLIASDEQYGSKYSELLKLHQEFSGIEMEEPSMAFSYKVMETIRTENSRQPLKAAINNRVILGIAAFFVLSITLMVVLSLSNVNWQAGGNAGFNLKIPQQLGLNNFKSIFTASVLKGFLFFDVVMGLFLMDSYLRRKPQTGQR